MTLDQRRHEDFAEQHESEECGQQHRERILGEDKGGGLAARGDGPGEERDKGGAEGAFGEQAAEQVGQALGDEKRVRHGPRAEQRGRQDVADKAQDPADERVGPDRGDRTQQRHDPVYRQTATRETTRGRRAAAGGRGFLRLGRQICYRQSRCIAIMTASGAGVDMRPSPLVGRGTVPLCNLAATIVWGALFYAVVTPVGMVMRLVGRNPLRVRPDPRATTYWTDRSDGAGGRKSMARQF